MTGKLRWLRSAVASIPPDGTSDENAGTTVSSALYACDACETTYISTEMESCPNCNAAVEEVPSGPDLGFTSA